MRHSSDTLLISARLSFVKNTFWFPLGSLVWNLTICVDCGSASLTEGKWEEWAIPIPVRNCKVYLCVDCVAFKRLNTCTTMKLPCACVCVRSALLHTFIWLGLPRWLIVWWCACSKTMTARTFRGRQIYTCNRGVWVKEGASADLIDPNNSKVASYKSNYNPNTRRSTLSWTLVNSAGVAGESGAPTCGITGTSILHIVILNYSQRRCIDRSPSLVSSLVSPEQVTIVDYLESVSESVGMLSNESQMVCNTQLERGKRVFVKSKEFALRLVTSLNLLWHHF